MANCPESARIHPLRRIKKHIIAFMLILIMSLICSLDSWGDDDYSKYSQYSDQLQTFIKSKVTKIPGFYTNCSISNYPGPAQCSCVLRFPGSESITRSIHAAQNITDMMAVGFPGDMILNTSLETSMFMPGLGHVLIYKIFYDAQYDVWTTVYRIP